MIRLINKVVILIVVILLTASCSNETSLQKYYVDSENKSDILMIDIPTSLLVVKEDISVEAKQALESIDKLNLLAFKLNNKNAVAFAEEKAKVKQILANSNYQELLKVNDKGRKVTVKYLGSDDAMDEVVVYASDKKYGFALGRLLGNNMKPENMLKLLEGIKDMDADNETFKVLKNFMK